MRWAILLGLLAGGCRTAIHQVHVSDFGPYAPRTEAGVPVEGFAEQRAILGMDVERVGERNKLRSATTDYVDEAWADLKRQCVQGDLTAITVETSTRLGFMSWTNRARLHGMCRPAAPSAAPPPTVAPDAEDPSEPPKE